MTYRHMWETYIEPNLEAQAEIRKDRGAPANTATFEDNGPPTVDRQVAEAQAFGFMFGADPLEVGKAVRKSWPVKASDRDWIRERLEERAKK